MIEQASTTADGAFAWYILGASSGGRMGVRTKGRGEWWVWTG